MKWCIYIIGSILVLTGYAADLNSQENEDAPLVLRIEWQRYVDENGKTCDRCGGTEEQLSRGVETLQSALNLLGIQVALEKKSMGSQCAENIIESNKILIAGCPLEKWLGAKVGTSECGSCCAKLGESVECRTTSVDGKTYEVIPAELIVKAGLKAASEIIVAPSTEECCPNKNTVNGKKAKCCP